MTTSVKKTVAAMAAAIACSTALATLLLPRAAHADAAPAKPAASQVDAHAGATAAKPQVPGYYRYQLGAFEVTALNDGIVPLDSKLYHHATQEHLRQMLARQFRRDPTVTSVNAYLINTGSKIVLVDAGTANLFGPTLGQLFSNLKAAGYEPDQIDDVFITHFHGDHVGGLAALDGHAAFPKAIVHADQAEVDYWLNPELEAKAAEDKQGFFKMARLSLRPYVQSGRLKTFKGSGELLPGVKAVATPKHTPGHTSYLIESQGQSMLVIGDLVHNVSVQFAEPDVSLAFDTDEAQAIATRKKVFAWAAKDKLLIAGAHLPFPGLGHIRAEGKNAFAWVPVDFAPLK